MNESVQNKSIEIDGDVLTKWQRIVDIMAKLMRIPAGLIMRINGPDIEVFVSSQTENNPYHPGDKEHLLGSGLYCEAVIKSRKKLLVPNALKDDLWKNNPDVKLNMISYLGFPIVMPSGEVFGTICVLDTKENIFPDDYEKLILEFKELIESHLKLVALNKELHTKNQQLKSYLEEIETLRGILPICSFCKKIRDDKGYWKEVEEYVSTRSEAEFTHSVCPECKEKHYGDYLRS